MKRMLLAALATSMLALLAPAVAAARHGHHHRGSHARTHKGHAKSSRLLVFGSPSALAPSGTGTPATPIVKPETEKAGTIESFKETAPGEGELTIKLSDGKTTISGKVTKETQIHCPAPPPEPSDNDDEEGDEEGSHEGDEHSSSAGSFAGQHGDVMAHSACDNKANAAENQNCTTASLQPKAVVLAAELKLTPSGPVWEQVDLG